METDNFETHIKTKLQERKINPSAKAWDTISKELRGATLPKKKNYYWSGVAASVLFLLGIVGYHFYDGAISFSLVESTKEVKPTMEAEEIILPIKKVERVIVDSELKTNLNMEDANKQGHSVKNNSAPFEVNNKAVFKKVNVKPIKKTLERLELSQSKINEKVIAIVDQVNILEQTGAVTDAEVDSLLRKAQAELVQNKILNFDRSVDAMALLVEVENELDQSFRDKVFERLKNSFIKVRTGVADLNK